MAEIVRRVVTGIDANGKSCIVSDGPAPGHAGRGAEIWRINSVPTVGPHKPYVDPTDNVFCPNGGLSIKQFVFPPGSITSERPRSEGTPFMYASGTAANAGFTCSPSQRRRAFGRRSSSSPPTNGSMGMTKWLVFSPALEQGRTFVSYTPRFQASDPSYRIITACRKQFLHYYFYVLDPVIGPMSLRFATYLPFNVTCYLNGHSFLAQELTHQGIKFHKVDNAIVAVADPAGRQAAANQLTPALLNQRCQHWIDQMGPRFPAEERAALDLGLGVRTEWGCAILVQPFGRMQFEHARPHRPGPSPRRAGAGNLVRGVRAAAG